MAEHLVTTGETRIAYRMLWRELLENIHLEGRQENGRMTLRWILDTLMMVRIRLQLATSSEDTTRQSQVLRRFRDQLYKTGNIPCNRSVTGSSYSHM
jgi:hypothetical protein